MKMTVSTLVLLMLGALIRGSCALRCHKCLYAAACQGDAVACQKITQQYSNPGCPAVDRAKVDQVTCDASANEDACVTLKGTTRGQNIYVPFLLLMSHNGVGILLPVKD